MDSNNQQINELIKTINEKDNLIQELYKENKELLYKNEALYKQIQEKDKQIFELHKQIQEKKIEEKEKEVEKMKPVFDEIEEMKKQFQSFWNSEIVKDIEYIKKLQEWVNDNDFFSKMKKGFSAKRDGFDSETWHKAVDGKGKTLVIIKTKQNFIFGGFTQVGWTNDKSKWRKEDRNDDNDGYIPDSNAFVFSLRNDKGDRKPKKFTIKQGEEEYAIFYDLSYGPVFGSDIELNSNLQPGYSNFGNIYNLPNGIEYDTNEARSYLAGSYNNWIVDELESYFI
ncbi:hypothetical protein M0811_03616 [Anaeramoeba ignava]|uniref:TLDc domain-containing protein n=1 Tax=Anaeramoeba ignava TaxID=1746090 RepID=A0A9Q0R4L2_ANAIG|nr:hypothetical protein M0811_03616 [Anaeramoeba ignava]